MRPDLRENIQHRHIVKQGLGWVAVKVAEHFEGLEALDSVPDDASMEEGLMVLDGMLPGMYARLDVATADLNEEAQTILNREWNLSKRRGC